jgi:hypothetical protein
MARHYVIFGRGQSHIINGITLDHNSIACYNAKDFSSGRDKAFQYFGRKFFTDYHAGELDKIEQKYFPRGIIEIEKIT